ncbi:MAG: hypothetical protein HDT32_05050 [Clostridiales bacterium]|nr:hypothetical protein [Clostridiales bacterium]
MYIEIYDENKRHISNVDNISYDLTKRVYDPNAFNAVGISADDVNKAKIAVMVTDVGEYEYACLVDNITPDGNKRTIKGLDFKTLWQTEILLDFTPDGSWDGRLSVIFNRVKSAVFDSVDSTVCKIPVEVIIPTDDTDTTEMLGSYQGQYINTDAYKFLKCYLKFYEYNIESRYDVVAGKIIFEFVKTTEIIDVNLSDFIYDLTTSSSTTNKAVATVKYDVATPETDGDGNVVYNADGTPKRKPRPTTIATKYYYLNHNNDIVQADARGEIEGRIYPVKTKWFEKEYLSEAQFDAVYELANSRFVDNIIIDNNLTIDPIDFAIYPLYTKIQLYYDGKLYKTLPISEKIITLNASGKNTQIKLGFKKILLTELLKG